MNHEDLFKELDNITDIKINDKSCCSNSSNFIEINGVLECNKCFKIISNIQSTPEWRYYGSDDNRSSDPTRCGMPVNILLPKSSVGSIILNQKTKEKNMNNIRKYQEWSSMTYKERSLYKVFNIISEITKINELPKVIEIEAKSLYKIISETKISRGNNRKGIIAACVYFACKTCAASRSQKEIAQMFSIRIPIITKGCKLFQEIIQMSAHKNRITDAISIKSTDFIDRFCNKLNLKENDIKSIKKIEININRYNIISEVRPDSISAGCILLYCKLNDINITKKDISEICRISEVTINKCYKKMEKNLDLLIN